MNGGHWNTLPQMASAKPSTCVDLPTPSSPSMTMKGYRPSELTFKAHHPFLSKIDCLEMVDDCSRFTTIAMSRKMFLTEWSFTTSDMYAICTLDSSTCIEMCTYSAVAISLSRPFGLIVNPILSILPTLTFVTLFFRAIRRHLLSVHGSSPIGHLWLQSWLDRIRWILRSMLR